MPWYFYVLDFLGGLLLANGVPHFVHGISGSRFQTPFASPPGVGASSPLVNVIWGYVNLGVGIVLLSFFGPQGAGTAAGWLCVGAGALSIALWLAHHFEKVRSGS